MKKIILSILLAISAICFSCNETKTKTETMTYTKTGNPAIDSLTDKIFKNPDMAPLYFQRAQEFYKNGAQGGYDLAIKDMSYALKLDSNNVGYHKFLSDIYLNYAQSRMALKTIERAADIEPTNKPILLDLTRKYLITKQYPAALSTIDKILRLDPLNSEAYLLTGIALRDQGDAPRAIKSFQRAADLDAKNTDAFIELGKIYTEKNNTLAEKYLDNALLIDSSNVNAIMAKAYYFQVTNKNEAAKGLYERVTSRDIHAYDANFNLALLYFDAGDFLKSNTCLQKVLDEKPSYYKAYYYRGLIKSKTGDKAGAKLDYQRALEINSGYEKAKKAVNE